MKSLIIVLLITSISPHAEATHRGYHNQRKHRLVVKKKTRRLRSFSKGRSTTSPFSSSKNPSIVWKSSKQPSNESQNVTNADPSMSPSNIVLSPLPSVLTTFEPSATENFPSTTPSSDMNRFYPSWKPSPKFSETPSINEEILDPSPNPSEMLSGSPSYLQSSTSSGNPSKDYVNAPSISPVPVLELHLFTPTSYPSQKTADDLDKDNEQPANGILIGGISAGIGIIGLTTLVTLFCRHRRSELVMVNTVASFDSMSPFPLPELDGSPISGQSSMTRDDNTAENSYNNFSENNHSIQNVNSCTNTYSEDSSGIFKCMSLTTSSIESGTISRFSFHEFDWKHTITREPTDIPLQQLRSELTGSLGESIGSNSKGESDVLQPTHQLARLMSCFSSTSILNNSNINTKSRDKKMSAMMSNDINDIVGAPSETDVISVVSSLSGKSSHTETTIEFHHGNPYEVLVPGNVPLGLVVKTTKLGPQVIHVKESSPLRQVVEDGDYILAIDGKDIRYTSAKSLAKWLHNTDMTNERTMILMGIKH